MTAGTTAEVAADNFTSSTDRVAQAFEALGALILVIGVVWSLALAVIAARMKLVARTHAGITTEQFNAACRTWLACSHLRGIRASGGPTRRPCTSPCSNYAGSPHRS